MVLPSKQYREWHTEALWQLKAQRVPQKKLSHFDVHVWFYAPDRRKADASNKFESIMDLLVDYGAIEDDSWWHTEEIVLHKAELDTKNPRVEIEITPVS